MIKGKIKYLHLSDNIYPLVTGGTELFIQQLINEQIKSKDEYEVLWVCHRSGENVFKKVKNLSDYKVFLAWVVKLLLTIWNQQKSLDLKFYSHYILLLVVVWVIF